MVLSQDLLTVLLIHWVLTTVDTMKMLKWCVSEVDPHALKVPSDFKQALVLWDVWRYVTTISGAQCVMTPGRHLML